MPEILKLTWKDIDVMCDKVSHIIRTLNYKAATGRTIWKMLQTR